MKKFLFILLSFLVAIQLDAQIAWNFTGAATGAASTTPANATISVMTIGNSLGTVAAPVSSTSPSTTYPGFSGTNNIGNACRTGALSTTPSTGSAYLEFTITPSPGYRIADITGFQAGTRSTGTGAQAFAIRTNLDSYAADIATGTIASTSTWALKTASGFSISAPAADQAVTIRIYLYNGTGSPGSNTINTRFDDISFTGVSIVLPISLSSFNVANINNSNELRFTTASESNNSHFEIERSNNGKNYETISRVEGKGTTQEVSNYSFSDRTPNKGINYYRLKQVDFDGRFEYSKVVSVYVGEKNLDVNVASATNDVVRLKIFSQNEDDAVIAIVDMNGRIVLSQKAILTAKDNQIDLDTNLQNGMYVVKITTLSGEQTSKMLNIK
jgi:hypothetical protein